MRIETIQKLCCPFDKEDLDLKITVKDMHDNVQEGLLVCQYCLRYYPIVSGIPIMVPDEFRERKLEEPFLHKIGMKPNTQKPQQISLEKMEL
jgi:uncharacterized protein YbaR (Trm112 family)